MSRYDAVGFDLLTALLDTWSLWKRVARDDALGMRWHAASQALLRGRDYLPFEDIVRDAANDVGGAARIGMDVYWANRGSVALPTGPAPIANESGLGRLVETLAR